MIKVEIEGVGVFEIKHNYLHRGNPRIMTFEKGKYKWLQFDSIPSWDKALYEFRLGYDLEVNEIRLRLIEA